MKYLIFLVTLLSSVAIAAPALPSSVDDGSVDDMSVDDTVFTDGFDGVDDVVQVVVPNQLKASAISYGPYVLTSRPNMDVTEWDNIWGHSNLVDAINPWPGGSGSAPVIRAFNRLVVLCAHFKTPSTPITPGFFTYPRNWVGSDLTQYGIDIAVSKIKCDFTPNAGSTNFNALPTDDVVLSYRGAPGNPNYYAILEPSTDYYLNVRAHLQEGWTFPLYLERN
jgi:hypothetical protein